MKTNYDLIMQSILGRLEGRPRLLLHACCAPCASSVTERLLEYVEPVLYYYNPNIMPREEYDRRAGELLRLGEILGVKVIIEEYDVDTFLSAVKGLEGEREGGARCPVCFTARLERTAQRAREMGIGWFSTTLTVSPHKNPELVNGVGIALSDRDLTRADGTEAGPMAPGEGELYFLPADFKKREGYKRSIELCRQYGIYRQDYCGCSFAREAQGRM